MSHPKPYDAIDRPGRAPGGSRRPEGADELGQLGLDFLPARLVGEQFRRRASDIFGRGGVLDEFRVKRLAGEDVGHGEITHLDDQSNWKLPARVRYWASVSGSRTTKNPFPLMARSLDTSVDETAPWVNVF